LAKNEGKAFEEDLKKSAEEQSVFFYRIKDVPPTLLKPRAKVSQNDFDSFIYKKPNLFPIELKSTKNKSVSFSESIIKAHQIQALKESADYEGLISGFVFNFREPDNKAYFVHINDFLEYKNVAENELDHTYKSKVNKSSIPIGICEELGIEIRCVKKRTRYRYSVKKLLDELIKKYNN
jgi:penicillin-binding protein-related factor A (putative recombinase)